MVSIGTPRATRQSRRELRLKKMMTRMTQLDPVQATGKTKQLFEAVQNKLGVVPNLFRILGVSPAALQGYLDFTARTCT